MAIEAALSRVAIQQPGNHGAEDELLWIEAYEGVIAGRTALCVN
jgi:hypothetical protein